MVTTNPQVAADRIDARPVRATSNETPWDQAIALRDKFAGEVRRTLEQEQLEAAVFVSANGVYPPWVKLEAWLPAKRDAGLGAGSRERAGLVFTIDAKPYYEHDIVISADLARGRTHIAVKDWPDFPIRYVAEWVRYALDRGPKPGNYTPGLDAILHLITAFIPFVHGPHSNRLLRRYRSWLTGAKLLGLVSVLLIIGGAGAADPGPYGEPSVVPYLAIALGVVGLIVTVLIVRFRKRAVSVTPQSELPPRDLGLVDSWHAVVAELGRDFNRAKQQLIEAIAQDASPGIACQTETYTHRAPNGYEQRERLVVTRDQGMVHVHIYQFGNDLFVGWYAYVNWAQWAETKPVVTKVHSGQEVQYLDLRPAIYVPSQFDLIDLSSLSEFVHRRLEREIKTLMKEKAIDQEIDFKVIRGDRDRALDEERHKAGEKKSGGAAWSYS